MGSGEGSTTRNFIVWVIKYKILRCAGLIARMEESRSAFNILTGNITGRIPLEWTFKKYELYQYEELG